MQLLQLPVQIQLFKHFRALNTYFFFKSIALQVWANDCIINYPLKNKKQLINLGVSTTTYQASYESVFIC